MWILRPLSFLKLSTMLLMVYPDINFNKDLFQSNNWLFKVMDDSNLSFAALIRYRGVGNA